MLIITTIQSGKAFLLSLIHILTTQQQELLALQSSMKQLQMQLQTRVQSFIGISQQLETAIAKETQEEQKATLQNIKAQLDTQIQELTNNLQQLAQGMNILEAKLAIIAQDMNELNVLSKQMNESVISGLNSAINEFSKGNEQLKQGLAMIQKQTANLPNLLKQFVAGSKQLSDGSTKVNNAPVSYTHLTGFSRMKPAVKFSLRFIFHSSPYFKLSA